MFLDRASATSQRRAGRWLVSSCLLSAILWVVAAIVGTVPIDFSAPNAAGRRRRSAALPARLSALPGPAETVAHSCRHPARRSHSGSAPEALWLMGFGLVPAGFACALDVSVATGIEWLAVRRGHEPARRARRIWPSKRRGAAHRMGGDEPRRRGDDSFRTPRSRRAAEPSCSCSRFSKLARSRWSSLSQFLDFRSPRSTCARFAVCRARSPTPPSRSASACFS